MARSSEVFVAIIAAAVALVPVLATTVYNPIFNKPQVVIQLIPNFENNSSKALINLTNNGVSSASNISLAVKAPSIIREVEYYFGTAKVMLNNKELGIGTTQPVNNNVLRTTIPKLAYDLGSTIQLSLTTDAKPNIKQDNYLILASYDQGSSVWRNSLAKLSVGGSFATLTYWEQILLIYGIVYGIFFPIYYFYWGKRRKGKRYVSHLVAHLLARREDPENKRVSDFSLSSVKHDIDNVLGRAIIREISDYLILRDLYHLIDKREEYIKKIEGNRGEDVHLQMMNDELFKLIAKTIEKIDWKKYYVDMKRVYRYEKSIYLSFGEIIRG